MWVQGRDGYPGLATIYIQAMDKLYPICPDCLFLVEGQTLSPL